MFTRNKNIEVEGSELLKNLGKYGCLRLEYLHGFKQEMYRELLFTGKLAEHCATVDMRAFELSERIRADYLKQHPMPEEDALERIRISEQAQLLNLYRECDIQFHIRFQSNRHLSSF